MTTKTTTTKKVVRPTLADAVALATKEARMEYKNQVLDELDALRDSARDTYLFPAKALKALDAVQDALISLEAESTHTNG